MDPEVTSRSQRKLTQPEFFAWIEGLPDDDCHRYELIHGRIVMAPPAGYEHGRLDAWLAYKLTEHVHARGLGEVLGSSAGYDLPSGDTLEPDLSFISKERLASMPDRDPVRFATVVPDLVIEILSPSTARRDRTVKKDIYAANGVRELWLVDTRRRLVTIFLQRGTRLDSGRRIASGVVPSQVLPELRLTIEVAFRL